jgi:hypothetical protein
MMGCAHQLQRLRDMQLAMDKLCIVGIRLPADHSAEAFTQSSASFGVYYYGPP